VSVYRPTYTDPKTGKKKQQRLWWYHFTFAGRHIQEPTKTALKTKAKEIEKARRNELENAHGGVEDKRTERVRTIGEIAAAFRVGHKARRPKSYTSLDYALRHVERILGKRMAVDISPEVIEGYQTTRIEEKAAPKTINEEVSRLLQILGKNGLLIRAELKQKEALKLPQTGPQIAQAFNTEQKAAMLKAAKARPRSHAIYPALALNLHAGLRDAEIRDIQWKRLDLARGIVTVGEAKSEAGEGRTIPLNADVMAALIEYSKWYLDRFGGMDPEWYVFPFGKGRATDPTRGQMTFKTAWNNVRKAAGVTGRWHDNRHTFITNLAESGEASDETIRQIAGHVSNQMLKHYSHIGMEAKRRAVDSLVAKPTPSQLEENPKMPAKESAKVAVTH
jgi:integrase